MQGYSIREIFDKDFGRQFSINKTVIGSLRLVVVGLPSQPMRRYCREALRVTEPILVSIVFDWIARLLLYGGLIKTKYKTGYPS